MVYVDEVEVEVSVVYVKFFGWLCIYVMISLGQCYVILLILGYYKCYLEVVVELMLVQCIFDMLEEGYDVFLVVVCELFDFGLIYCQLGSIFSIFCVVFVYLDKYGLLQYFGDFLNYVCL